MTYLTTTSPVSSASLSSHSISPLPLALELKDQTDPTYPSESQDRPFNGFRRAVSDRARQLVHEVCEGIQKYETYRTPRKRGRRVKDQQTFERQVEAVVCDLAHRTITSPGEWIAVSFSNDVLGKANRYRSTAITKKLPDVICKMATLELEFAELIKGFRSDFKSSASRQSVVRAGRLLRSRIAELCLTTSDFGLEKSQELIILKASKENYSVNGKRIPYDDTPQTIADRKELRCINDWLSQADIDYLPTGPKELRVDLSDRLLRRYFNNGSFEQGGRLFGGFWQPMRKPERHGIYIDGMETVTLDFGQMVPRMLYGLVGEEPPEGDAYTVPGLEHYRDGVKAVFNSMLHVRKGLGRMPRGTRELIPKRYSVNDVTDKITAFHEPVAQYFYAGHGLHLLYQESKILITVLNRLREQGIVGLPIHDAVVVAKNNAEEVKQIMLDVFKEMTGVEGLVSAED